MLWRTSPAATELEEVALDWLRELHGSAGRVRRRHLRHRVDLTLHALAAAREAAVPGVRELRTGRTRGRRRRSRLLLGARAFVGRQGRHPARARPRVAAPDSGRRRSSACGRRAARGDRGRSRGRLAPIAVVATVGTTSTTSVDPVRGDRGDLPPRRHLAARRRRVRGRHARCSRNTAHTFDGWERADSIVVNPHKWLFTPFDLSAFYCRRMDVVRQAFSLVPEYLQTAEGARGVRNLMDTGIQLGRRFRSLKLWMVLRHFGAEGIRACSREHMRLAQLFAAWVDAAIRTSSASRRCPSASSASAPAGGRAHGAELDALNERLLDAVNATGEVFLSHTRLDGRVRAAPRHRPSAHDGAARRESLGTAQGALCRGAIVRRCEVRREGAIVRGAQYVRSARRAKTCDLSEALTPGTPSHPRTTVHLERSALGLQADRGSCVRPASKAQSRSSPPARARRIHEAESPAPHLRATGRGARRAGLAGVACGPRAGSIDCRPGAHRASTEADR